MYFGKPVVGIPVMFDQHMNMRLAEQKGYGVSNPFEKLYKDSLMKAVTQVLSNDR